MSLWDDAWQWFKDREWEVAKLSTSKPLEVTVTLSLSPKEIRRMAKLVRGCKLSTVHILTRPGGGIGTSVSISIDGIIYDVTDYGCW